MRQVEKKINKLGCSKFKLVTHLFCSQYMAKTPPGNIVLAERGGWGTWEQSCTPLCLTRRMRDQRHH